MSKPILIVVVVDVIDVVFIKKNGRSKKIWLKKIHVKKKLKAKFFWVKQS